MSISEFCSAVNEPDPFRPIYLLGPTSPRPSYAARTVDARFGSIATDAFGASAD